MRRLCKYCGQEYEGDPTGSCCPDCAAKQRKTSVRQRTCQTCGITFLGGSAARYCPDCRAERQREQARRYRQEGTQRPLGSTDYCITCGKPYIVCSGQQHYCPDCRPIEYQRLDRAASRRWNAENTTPDDRRETRQAASAPIQCVICGKPFVPRTAAKTCSPECSAELRRRTMRRREDERREERKAYHRELSRKKAAAMTPEEYRAYREKINSRARENQKKRLQRKSPEELQAYQEKIRARAREYYHKKKAKNKTAED